MMHLCKEKSLLDATSLLQRCSCSCVEAIPLRDVNAHAEHLRLEALLVVTQRTSEKEEPGAVGLVLAQTFTTEGYTQEQSKNTFRAKII